MFGYNLKSFFGKSLAALLAWCVIMLISESKSISPEECSTLDNGMSYASCLEKLR